MDGTLRPIDNFFLQRTEPLKGCLEYLRHFMNNYNPGITEEWKYKLPFYYYKGKMFCYFWIDKKTQQPYIGVVEGGRIDHPLLVAGERKRMKVIYIDAAQDVPTDVLTEVLDMALKYYK